MRIRSRDHIYTVVARGQGGASKRPNLLVKNETGASFLMLVIDEPEVTRSLAPMFLSFGEKEAFRDFVESFSFGAWYCVVFVSNSAPGDRPVALALAGAPPQARVEAVRLLIGGFLAQETPYPVICDLLRQENLLCSAAGKIKFVYDLVLSADYDRRDCKNKTQVMLGETVREIFTQVNSPALDRFVEALEAWRFASMEEIYAGFAAIADEVAAAPAPPFRPPALGEKLKEALGRLAAKAIPLGVVVLLLVGYLFLGRMFFYTVIYPLPADNGIEAIGTVEVNNEQDR